MCISVCWITETLTETTESSSLKILPHAVVFIFLHCVYGRGKETAAFIKHFFQELPTILYPCSNRSMHVFKFALHSQALLPVFIQLSLFHQRKQLIFLNKYVYLVQIPLRLSRHNSDAYLET